MFRGLELAAVEMAAAKMQVESGSLEERSIVENGRWNHAVARRCGNRVCSEPQCTQRLTAVELKQLAADARGELPKIGDPNIVP